jgi:hypothetical protein
MANPYDRFDKPSAPRNPTLREQKSLADLQSVYASRDAERDRLELDRRRVALAEAEAARKPQPKDIGTQLREQSVLDAGKALTGAAVNARTKLPTLADQAEAAFAAGRELVEHPGFEATVGAPNPFKGGFGPLGTFPGSRARDFTSRLDNTKAQAFLQAFETLKGAGAITEAEGKAATQALANLDTSVSEEQFKKNLQSYLDVIKRGYDRTQKTANIQPVPYSRDMLMAEKQRRAALKAGGQ